MSNGDRTTMSPGVLYVHDDLTDEVRAQHGSDSAVFALTGELMSLVARDSGRVTIITLASQLEALIARGSHDPFAVTIGIGRAGERVAGHIHRRTGWFPVVRRIDLTREEEGQAGYRIVTLSGAPIDASLRDLGRPRSLALVDDTIFSGLTIETVLAHLPAGSRPHTFCLRGVGETIERLRARCPVSVGFAAPGRMLHDVSFINASGLVRRGSIRRAGLPPLAFFERPEWIRAWFPAQAEEVIARCRELNGLLAGD
jgi:hypothetical protein